MLEIFSNCETILGWSYIMTVPPIRNEFLAGIPINLILQLSKKLLLIDLVMK